MDTDSERKVDLAQDIDRERNVDLGLDTDARAKSTYVSILIA